MRSRRSRPTAWRQKFTAHTDHTKRATPKLRQAGFADENAFKNQSAILSTPAAFADLARAYLFDDDRAKAQEIANAGQQQYPNSFEIRQVMDMMETDEKLGAKPTYPRAILFVIGFLLFFGATVRAFCSGCKSRSEPDADSDPGLWLARVGCLASSSSSLPYWVGHAAHADKCFHKRHPNVMASAHPDSKGHQWGDPAILIQVCADGNVQRP